MADIKRKFIRKIFDVFHLNRSIAFHIQFSDAFKAQRQLIKNQAPIIIDVGAFDGRSARLYKKYFSDAIIYSFEPFPPSFAILQNNKVDNQHTLYPFAVADNNGKSNLHVNRYAATNSLLESSSYGLQVSPEQTTQYVIEIEQRTLDSFCKENNLIAIDILKIDVQGGELKVLQGARDLLENKKITLIYFEVEFRELYKEQPMFDNLSMFLRSLGYHFFAFYNSSYLRNGQMIAADAIFIRS